MSPMKGPTAIYMQFVVPAGTPGSYWTLWSVYINCLI